MRYEFFIALRYLRSKRKNGFISLITYISVFGIVIGVAALIIVLSVMNGLEREVRSRFLGVDAHIKVNSEHDRGMNPDATVVEKIRNTAHVVALSPYVSGKALARSHSNQAGIYVHGIEPETAVQVTDIGKSINYGALDLGLVPGEDEPPLPGVVLGFNLADKLIVTLGDKITIASFNGITRFGQMPQLMQFRVAGYFETGLYEFDDNFAYISLESAQKLFRMGDHISGLELRLDDYELADRVGTTIMQQLAPPLRAQTWRDLNPHLYAWMEIEKWLAFLILCLIIMVAAFNIASTLIMVTLEKTREIGILRSMGASSRGIRRIFTYQGVQVGLAGTVLGNLIGYGVCWAQQTWRFFALPSDIYIIDWLPVATRWSDFALITIAALAITLTAAIFPAARAAKLDPVQALRYE